MSWRVDDPPLTVASGQTSSEDLGKQFGEVLAVFKGGQVTSFVVKASAPPDGTDPSDPNALTCPLAVSRSG